MVINEGARHAMFARLEEVLGEEQATTLMEHLPPVGWADVATKNDLEAQRIALSKDIEALESRLTASFKDELLSQTKTYVNWMLATTFSAMFAVAGLAFGAARLV